jgi:2-phospho-L-lactate guanylyltransferase
VATRLILGLQDRRERTLPKTNAPMRLDEDMQWSAIVPVKGHNEAKSRLESDPNGREALSRVFLSDVLTALKGSEFIDQVIVVTDDVDLVSLGTPRIRVKLLISQGLNEDIQQGLDLIGHGPVVVLTSDLPCLTSQALDEVLALANDHPLAFVSDAQGLGTTMLLAHVASTCTPLFGIRSHARHAQSGCTEITSRDPATQAALVRARRDVDTGIDLWDAQRIGVGPATHSLLKHNP